MWILNVRTLWLLVTLLSSGALSTSTKFTLERSSFPQTISAATSSLGSSFRQLQSPPKLLGAVSPFGNISIEPSSVKYLEGSSSVAQYSNCPTNVLKLKVLMNGCHTTSILSCIHNQVTQELIATLLSELGFTPLPKTVIASYFFKEANCANFRAAQNISGVRLNLDQTSLSNLTCRVIAYSGHFLMCNRSMLQGAISEGKVVTVDLESCTPSGLPTSAPTTASTVRPSETSPLSNHWQTPYLNKPLTETVREPTVPVDAGMPIGEKMMIIAMGLLPVVIVAIVVWCLCSRDVVEYGQVPRENIELRSLPPALQSDHSSTD